MVSNSSPKASQLATKSLGCESSEKCNNTKLEGVQLQDERAPLTVWDIHHDDVASMWNLEMTFEAILHSLV